MKNSGRIDGRTDPRQWIDRTKVSGSKKVGSMTEFLDSQKRFIPENQASSLFSLHSSNGEGILSNTDWLTHKQTELVSRTNQRHLITIISSIKFSLSFTPPIRGCWGMEGTSQAWILTLDETGYLHTYSVGIRCKGMFRTLTSHCKPDTVDISYPFPCSIL